MSRTRKSFGLRRERIKWWLEDVQHVRRARQTAENVRILTTTSGTQRYSWELDFRFRVHNAEETPAILYIPYDAMAPVKAEPDAFIGRGASLVAWMTSRVKRTRKKRVHVWPWATEI